MEQAAGPETNPLTDRLRPFWSLRRTAKALGLSEAQVHERVAAGNVLGLTTSDQVLVFPVWQFTSDPDEVVRVYPGVQAFCRELTDQDQWSVAILLKSDRRVDELDGRAPMDVVRAGDEAQLAAYGHQVWREWRQ
ncbi:hypothetical protein [Aeromicrobium sp. 50.2.37]|jgi:hypothetical protein|uniref:hypothetical protein n=1 Tax=Aeromicrobium sp. 50.2.37 TaxID=2969305 RepID=UPI00214FF967|nr:hypothetical protein [Aeromicrobium sp. 50.2.37]MCR4511740.1 hypothetical protein [Aeromicrobium sp. 50.2.37]